LSERFYCDNILNHTHDFSKYLFACVHYSNFNTLKYYECNVYNILYTVPTEVHRYYDNYPTVPIYFLLYLIFWIALFNSE